MDWEGIASVVFICTAANHLGLIAAVEQTIRHRLPVVNCAKCLTCWSTMALLLATGCSPLTSLAVSLLCSYLAIWLELLMYAIDTLYNKIYDTLNNDTEKD